MFLNKTLLIFLGHKTAALKECHEISMWLPWNRIINFNHQNLTYWVNHHSSNVSSCSSTIAWHCKKRKKKKEKNWQSKTVYFLGEVKGTEPSASLCPSSRRRKKDRMIAKMQNISLKFYPPQIAFILKLSYFAQFRILQSCDFTVTFWTKGMNSKENYLWSTIFTKSFHNFN